MEKAGKIKPLLFIGVLLISFITPFVLAQGVAGEFTTIFTDWGSGNIGPNIAKIFFFIMIFLLVLLVLTNIFSNFNKTIVTLLSVIVAFLSTAYLTSAEVYSLLNSYSALGLALTTLLPLIIIGSLSYSAAKSGSAEMSILQYFAWALFAVYSIYRVIYDWAVTKQGSVFVNTAILVTAVVAVVVFFFNNSIMRFVTSRYIQSSEEAAKRTMREASAAARDFARTRRELADRS